MDQNHHNNSFRKDITNGNGQGVQSGESSTSDDKQSISNAQNGNNRPQSEGSRPPYQGRPRPTGGAMQQTSGSRPGFGGMRPMGARPVPRQEKQELHAINDRIHAREVRLVGDNVENGIYSIQEARRIADDLELDLVEISATAQPPVCKIIDYQKFLYQQKKKQKEQKAKAAKVVIKEIRFGPQTDDHDYNFKLKHAQGFLQEGSKVKAYVFFKGRSILFKEQGEVLLLRFARDLEDYGKVEQMPVLEGQRMILMLSPKKK